MSVISMEKVMKSTSFRNRQTKSKYTFKSLTDCDIQVEVQILSKDVELIRSLIYGQLEVSPSEFHQNLNLKNIKEAVYWNTIIMLFKGLLQKVTTDNNHDVFCKLSFAELDCLVGALEVEVQKYSLSIMNMLPVPNVPRKLHIEATYNRLLIIYEQQKSIFLSLNKATVYEFPKSIDSRQHH